eukprot:TRINITY_DN5407_c0_g1_i1.p1 TRINITY_DN5407_c0_g1~~TRINITY_DN5407_c0_g1_i1.p1  ORF type:complete len:849 (+),score=173.72 TRINITY_DN5407_c0_g1_i1:89-2635(+)
MATGAAQWTEPELSQFYQSIRDHLTFLNEHRQANKPIPDEFWQNVSDRVQTKSAEHLKGLYEKQSTLLHVSGVTKEIFMASVADLLKVVDVAASNTAPSTITPIQQPTTSLTATLMSSTAIPDAFRVDKMEIGDDAKSRPKRKSPFPDDSTQGDDDANGEDGSARKGNKLAVSTANNGRKARRLSDELNGEEGAEEGVAELLALLVSPGKPPTPTPTPKKESAGAVGSSFGSSRRSDEILSYDEKDDMDMSDEESDETDDDFFADDPFARKLLERNLLDGLRNSKFQLWCMYEWLYPNIDLPWYQQNEFQGCLDALNLSHVTAGTRAQWSHIRSVLGRPRRFSPQFLFEQREELAEARARLRQEAAAASAASMSGGLSPSVLSLGINERCIAFHPPTKQILKGVLREKLDNGVYKVAFDSVISTPPVYSPPESSSTKRQLKPLVEHQYQAPPQQDLITDDLIMSLRYNIATIDRLQKTSVPRTRHPPPPPQLVYPITPSVTPQVASPPPSHSPAPAQTRTKQAATPTYQRETKPVAKKTPGRKPKRISSDSDSSVEDIAPVRYYNPRRGTASRRGRAGARRQPRRGVNTERLSSSSSSDSDEESDQNLPPQALMQAPATSTYSHEDVAAASRVFTLLNAKEIILQDLKMINDDVDRLMSPDVDAEDSIPDEYKRAYTWLAIKLSYVNKKLESELESLHDRQESVESVQPFLSSQAMMELSSQHKPNLSGGLYSNWYLEMGRACRRQVQQILEPVQHSQLQPSASNTEQQIVSDAKKLATNAANMIIHVTSCRNLPLSTEQVALALDAALSQLKPKYAQNRALYAQLRDLVANYQTKIVSAATSSPNHK